MESDRRSPCNAGWRSGVKESRQLWEDFVMSDPMQTNRHPVDELGDVREQMKLFEQREKDLREHILTHSEDLVGDEFAAYIQTQNRSQVDMKRLKQHVGEDVVREFTTSKPTKVLLCERKGKTS